MQVVLMHKNDMVARMIFTDAGYFSVFEGFYNKELMPPGTRVQDAMVAQRFKTWLENRCIPKDRENYIKLLSSANVNTQEQFYLKNYGLSLNDCYWLKSYDAINSEFGWNEVNFFKNDYSDYVGNLLTDDSFLSYVPDFLSPDLTTPGTSAKMWYQDKDTLDSYILKFGTEKYNYQEVYIEAAVSVIAKRLGIPHVEYEVVDKELYNGKTRKACMAKNFCSEDIEFISAQSLMVEPGMVGKNGMLNYAKRLGLKSQLDKMLVLDYITCNTERNMSNFGFLRDSKTFESLGFAPIFDNGNSLWIDYATNGIGKTDEAKPFEFTHEKQIEIVDDFSWIDFDNFDNIEFDIKQILRHSYIPHEIQDKICIEVRNRIVKLYEISKRKHPKIAISNKPTISKTEKNEKIVLSQPSNGFGS